MVESGSWFFTIQQYGIRQYDWIISLEVAEHIPEKYEDVYLERFCH
jgi:2-polyprenyl-3-methyl-5-hydroxy-6-metoxy-1,4-benzoquinol methylase